MSDQTPAQHDRSSQENGKPWGFFETILLATLAFAGYLIAQMAVIPFFTPSLSNFSMADLKKLSTNGNFISLSTIVSTIVICLILILFTYLRKNYPTKVYMGFTWPTWKEFGFWLAVLIGLNLLMAGLFTMLGWSMKSPEMIALYKNTELAILFWITVVIAAPFAEEFFFRGFLLESWKHSFLGVYGAIILTALIWGVIHLQYDWHIIGVIVLMGIVFGLARTKTGSLYLVMTLHAINNFASMIEMHFFQMG